MRPSLSDGRRVDLARLAARDASRRSRASTTTRTRRRRTARSAARRRARARRPASPRASCRRRRCRRSSAAGRAGCSRQRCGSCGKEPLVHILHDTSRRAPNVPLLERHGVKAALRPAPAREHAVRWLLLVHEKGERHLEGIGNLARVELQREARRGRARRRERCDSRCRCDRRRDSPAARRSEDRARSPPAPRASAVAIGSRSRRLHLAAGKGDLPGVARQAVGALREQHGQLGAARRPEPAPRRAAAARARPAPATSSGLRSKSLGRSSGALGLGATGGGSRLSAARRQARRNPASENGDSGIGAGVLHARNHSTDSSRNCA